MKDKFSENKVRYSITDPYKVAMLLCLGAEIVERNTENPNSIIFTLEHEKMDELVNMIHSGEPSDLTQYAKHLKDIRDYIKDVKCNIGRGQ